MKNNEERNSRTTLGISSAIPDGVRERVHNEYPGHANYNEDLFNELSIIIEKIQSYESKCKRSIGQQIIDHKHYFDAILHGVKSVTYLYDDQVEMEACDKKIFNNLFPYFEFIRSMEYRILNMENQSSWDKEILALFITLHKLIASGKYKKIQVSD